MKGLLFFLSLAWLAIGTWITKSQLCADTEKELATTVANKSTCESSLIFQVDKFNLKSESNFEFSFNSATLIEPVKVSEEVLTKVSQFLADNSDKTLAIEGMYHAGEKNKTGQNNLGIARAATIKEYLVANHGFNEDQLRLNSIAFDNRSCYDNEAKSLKRGANMTFGLVE